MTQKNGLAELAAAAESLSAERRHELEKQIQLGGNPLHDKGYVAGLARAADLVATHSPEVAKHLREMVAVAAARTLTNEVGYQSMCEWLDSPENRAQLEAEAELVRSGQAVGISLEDVIQEMTERRKQVDNRNGS